ncbi:MAG TPA: hypothetical protein VFB92_14965 [Vicinamibacterales bacterium]|nr:hypothetical protein [Vicinamibacterales bacterium]
MRLLLAAGVLCTAFLVIYLPDLGHGFLKDDFVWILSSRSVDLSDVGALFKANVGFYRPLVSLTFAADYGMWGMRPFGFGLTNLAVFGACAVLLYGLARRFTLPPAAALLTTAVWAFNFHGVNMALLWLSGRTSLLVTFFSLLTTHALLMEARLSAGVLCLAALLSKEEATLLPLLLTVFVFAVQPIPFASRLRQTVLRVWPMWVALAGYAVLRLQSGAFGFSNAPSYYQLSTSQTFRNLVEYADRSGTVAVAVVLLMVIACGRRPVLEEPERRAVLLSALWIVGTFAITLWLPVRSSLYALLPSIGTSLIAGATASWMIRTNPVRFRLVAIVLPALVVLLIPVYRIRNVRWVGIADISNYIMQTVEASVRGATSGGRIVIVDSRDERFDLDSTFSGMFPEAVTLVAGPDWNGEIIPAGEKLPDDVRLLFHYTDGRLIPIDRAQ